MSTYQTFNLQVKGERDTKSLDVKQPTINQQRQTTLLHKENFLFCFCFVFYSSPLTKIDDLIYMYNHPILRNTNNTSCTYLINCFSLPKI